MFELISPQDWPLKGRYGQKSNYSHSMIYNESRSECGRVDRERNIGHWIAWLDEGKEEEGAKWMAWAFRAKNSAFSSEEIWKGIFSFYDSSRHEKMCWFISQNSAERVEQNLWTEDNSAFRQVLEKCRSPVKERNLRSKPFEKQSTT